jgi:hypothetical protein
MSQDYPPPPPGGYSSQPPQKPTLRQRIRRLPLFGKIGLGCAGVLVVACCAFGIAAIAAGGGGGTTGAGSTPTTIARVPTHTPTPAPTQPPTVAPGTPSPTFTATPTPAGPSILLGATLGGLQNAFQAKYGSPSGTGTAKSYNFTIQNTNGVVTATPLGANSSDGKEHIASLRIGPPAADWTAATAQTICAAFLPPDAKFVETQNIAGDGPERVYTSADLALSFGASEFTDGNTGLPVTPGTFAMELWPGVGLNTGCILVLGK